MTPGPIEAAHLRHALRTPLNQITGYAEMLTEDLTCAADHSVRIALEEVRQASRSILELLQAELPPERVEVSPERLSDLRRGLDPLLQTITSRVGTLISENAQKPVGLNLADVLRIGSAAAELVEFAAGGQQKVVGSHALREVVSVAEALTSGIVLVVDDNPGNCEVLRRTLERNGLEVMVAHSGADALKAAGEKQPDLILLDLMMPGMDGMQVLRKLKENIKLRRIPVIMLSALDETTRVIQSLEIGAEDYVVKPFDPVLLLARLRSTLERSRLRVAESLRARELELAYERLRENEKRLQESEERLRLATEAADVGIFYYYAQQARVLMTPVGRKLFGLGTGEAPVPYEQMQSRIHPQDRERVAAEIAKAIDHQSELDSEFRVVWSDETVHWLSARGLGQCHGSAREIRLAGVALEITTRKRAEEAVLQTHKLESIGLLAGGIAHDFNNLLTGIIGSSSFVLDSLPEDDPNVEMLQNVVSSGERAADLTRQLLAYSGRGKFTVRKLDVSNLVSEIVGLIKASMPRTVTFNRDLAHPLPLIECDGTQIQQVTMNLVLNGAEAIVGEGMVKLTTKAVSLADEGREAFVFGGDVPNGEYVCLEVSDTGRGMDAATLSRIFEPFFTTKFTGRGLGLPAVFGIVRSHNGALEIRTTQHVGTTVRAYFPTSKD